MRAKFFIQVVEAWSLMDTTALMLGVAGQDGAYLARLLLEKGYRVVGSSRDAQMANTTRLEQLALQRRWRWYRWRPMISEAF